LIPWISPTFDGIRSESGGMPADEERTAPEGRGDANLLDLIEPR
jgi:hypothetical protein